jgi:hypothetical protein
MIQFQLSDGLTNPRRRGVPRSLQACRTNNVIADAVRFELPVQPELTGRTVEVVSCYEAGYVEPRHRLRAMFSTLGSGMPKPRRIATRTSVINAQSSARCISLATTALTRLAILTPPVMPTSVPISASVRFRLVLRGVGRGRQFWVATASEKKVYLGQKVELGSSFSAPSSGLANCLPLPTFQILIPFLFPSPSRNRLSAIP